MWRFFWVVGLCLAQNSIYFNDDILYQLNVESNAVLNEEKISPEKLIPIVTYDNERLRCTLPVVETEVSPILFITLFFRARTRWSLMLGQLRKIL